MSWSIGGVGKASAVADKIGKDAQSVQCSEPEESIKKLVVSALQTGLRAFPPGYAVNVSASGSQWAPNYGEKPEQVVNNLTVSLTSLGQLVE